MKNLIITGGQRLAGDLRVGGSKNAALPILFATLLIGEPVLLTNVPQISDIDAALRLLADCGIRIACPSPGTYELTAENAAPGAAEESLARSIRGSIYLLGAELARFGEAAVPLPGGCNFGERPLNCHFAVLRALGAEITEVDGFLYARRNRLCGTSFSFPRVSVGATVNALLASVLAEGRTVLYGTAQEPHILDLIGFLNAAGAKIRVWGEGVLVIEGVRRLHGCRWRITPDMIEAGTYLIAAAATGGEICIRDADPGHLVSVIGVLGRCGAVCTANPAGIRLHAPGVLRAVDVRTAPYPGFPTDLQPQITALLCRAEGISHITETVWSDRFRYLSELRKMGAEIDADGGCAICRGVRRLKGAELTLPDLRAGAALTIAALSAEGESCLQNAEVLRRGYADFVGKLTALGADIREEINDGCGI